MPAGAWSARARRGVRARKSRTRAAVLKPGGLRAGRPPRLSDRCRHRSANPLVSGRLTRWSKRRWPRQQGRDGRPTAPLGRGDAFVAPAAMSGAFAHEAESPEVEGGQAGSGAATTTGAHDRPGPEGAARAS